jgi:hypothetical protein
MCPVQNVNNVPVPSLPLAALAVASTMTRPVSSRRRRHRGLLRETGGSVQGRRQALPRLEKRGGFVMGGNEAAWGAAPHRFV